VDQRVASGALEVDAERQLSGSRQGHSLAVTCEPSSTKWSPPVRATERSRSHV
jgi:hypothetical protein